MTRHADRSRRRVYATRPRFDDLEARCLLSAGDLDTAFNGNGMRAVDVQGNTSSDTAGDVAVQTIGGISKELVVGSTNVGGVSQPFVLRLTLTGDLDSTFAGGGKSVVNLAKGSTSFNSLAVLPNGSFLAVGSSLVKQTTAVYDTQVVLAKFTANGSLDTTFGSKGVVGTNLYSGTDAGYSVAVQPDGKIVVAGLSQKSPDGFGRLDDNGFIARYTAAGALDGTFGSGGVAIISCDTATAPAADHISRVTVQADPSTGAVTSYTLLGEASDSSGTRAVVTRLTPSGARMAGWGQGNGRVDLAIVAAPFSTIQGLAIDQNGRVIVAGTTPSGPLAGTIAVLTPQGVLDTTLTGGDPSVPLGYARVVAPGSYGFVNAAVDSSNRIVVSGLQSVWSPATGDDVDDNIQVFRFLPSGQRDTSFGAANGGYGLADATPAAGANSNDWVSGLAIQPDGKIVVVGSTHPVPGTTKAVDILLARFQGDATLTITRATGPRGGHAAFAATIKPHLNAGDPSAATTSQARPIRRPARHVGHRSRIARASSAIGHASRRITS